MKKLLLFLMFIAVAYKSWDFYKAKSMEPLFATPYIAVYGRETCGFTRETVRALSQAGVKFHYLNVDDSSVADSLHARMNQSGISTNYYLLPVVDLNNSISIRPEYKDVLIRARALSL
jgi:glutaredoxin